MSASLDSPVLLSRPGRLVGLLVCRDRLVATCARGVERWRAWRRREQDARILRDMSERELRDLGLGRSDVPCVVRDLPPGDGWR